MSHHSVNLNRFPVSSAIVAVGDVSELPQTEKNLKGDESGPIKFPMRTLKQIHRSNAFAVYRFAEIRRKVLFMSHRRFR